MRIQSKHIPGVLDALEFEMFKGKEWLALCQERQSIRGDDMHAFATRRQAEDYLKENNNGVWSYALVPARPLYEIITGITKFLLSGEVRSNDIHIELDEVLKNYDKNLLNSKTYTMIQDNLKFLQENVKYMGFADATLSDRIAKNMEQGVPEFHLKTASTFNNRNVEAELSFRKSDKSDMYFFNRYTADLKNDTANRSQTFYIDNGKGITFKEAFNLLEGRSVHKQLTNKEQEKYNAWLQLDFGNKDKHNNYEMKRYTEGYGFDLDKTLKAFPIKELATEDDAKKLTASIAKGNVQSVTLTVNGQPEKMFIQANPKDKTVELFDGHMKPLTQQQMKGLMVTVLEGPAEKQAAKQGTTQGQSQAGKQEKGVKNNAAEDNGLLQKKRVSRNKGLALT